MAISKVIYKSSPSATPVTWMDTTQKTVTAASMLSGTTALKNDGTDITGSIATKTSSDLTSSGTTVTVPAGYYASNATKTVSDQNLVAGNIKKDVSIFGVTGSYEGSGSSITWETVYIGTHNFTYDWGNGNVYVPLPLWYEPIELNSIWRITWDDTEYECTATWSANGASGYALGNYTLDDGSGGTQCPFFISAYSGGTEAYIVTATSGTHYIKIEKQTTETVMWETVHMGVYSIVGEDVGGYIATYLKPFDAIPYNSVWRVTYNDTPYICTATQLASTTMNPDYGIGYAIGNYGVWGGSTNTGEPFLAGVLNWSPTQLIVGTVAQSGNVSIRIERMVGNLIPKTITQNGTYSAEDDNADGYSSVTVNVSGGLVYETGTYTPASDVSQPTISFSNAHTTIPIMIMFVDATGTYNSTSDTNYSWMYYDNYGFTGQTMYQSSDSLVYARVVYHYRSSNVSLLASSASTVSNDSGYSSYVTSSGFYPSSNSTSRYWRSGRTYNWIAVWAPTS